MAATKRTFVSSYVEDRELPHLVCGGENRSQIHQRREVVALHFAVPVLQGTVTVWVPGSKLVQPFPGDDVHTLGRESAGYQS
jgi:hypothetical protein